MLRQAEPRIVAVLTYHLAVDFFPGIQPEHARRTLPRRSGGDGRTREDTAPLGLGIGSVGFDHVLIFISYLQKRGPTLK